MTPGQRATAVLAWLGHRSAAEVDAALADPAQAMPLLAHADALADAADSDDEAVRSAGIAALFAGLVEPLNDGFSPAGRALYARLFTRIAWRVCARDRHLGDRLSEFAIANEEDLRERYRYARQGGGRAPSRATKVAVLSRVTIGADILLTSVALQRLAQRYPSAEIVLIGDAKLAGLFAGLPRVRVHAVAYARRGPLRERLASWLSVANAVAAEAPDLVVAPDSRLDQLGVMPVIADRERYLLWENTQDDGSGAWMSLADRLDAWLAAHLQLPHQPQKLPSIAFPPAVAAERERLHAALGGTPLAAVKLDHGGNPAKALPRAGEVAVLRALRELGWRILLDRGFGSEELANSDALLTALGWTAHDLDDSGAGLGQAIDALTPQCLSHQPVVRFHGSIAGWAAALSTCGLAISYDSVGHHLAAALGVPLVVAFTGFTDPRFPDAWRPRGAGRLSVVTIPTAEKDRPEHWRHVIDALPPPGTTDRYVRTRKLTR